jgi:hypothetical protein
MQVIDLCDDETPPRPLKRSIQQETFDFDPNLTVGASNAVNDLLYVVDSQSSSSESSELDINLPRIQSNHDFSSSRYQTYIVNDFNSASQFVAEPGDDDIAQNFTIPSEYLSDWEIVLLIDQREREHTHIHNKLTVSSLM